MVPIASIHYEMSEVEGSFFKHHLGLQLRKSCVKIVRLTTNLTGKTGIYWPNFYLFWTQKGVRGVNREGPETTFRASFFWLLELHLWVGSHQRFLQHLIADLRNTTHIKP